MLMMAIPDVEILAACLCTIWLKFICQIAPKIAVQEVESLRGQGQHMGSKVVNLCSYGGQLLFTCSDTLAVGCIV